MLGYAWMFLFQDLLFGQKLRAAGCFGQSFREKAAGPASEPKTCGTCDISTTKELMFPFLNLAELPWSEVHHVLLIIWKGNITHFGPFSMSDVIFEQSSVSVADYAQNNYLAWQKGLVKYEHLLPFKVSLALQVPELVAQTGPQPIIKDVVFYLIIQHRTTWVIWGLSHSAISKCQLNSPRKALHTPSKRQKTSDNSYHLDTLGVIRVMCLSFVLLTFASTLFFNPILLGMLHFFEAPEGYLLRCNLRCSRLNL